MYRIIILSCFLFCMQAFSQDTIRNSSEKESKWEVNIDLASRYIWRGQSWGGDYAVVQPNIKYHVNKKFSIGAWATHNFKQDYFYPDGSYYKGYQELDFYVEYKVNDCLSFELWDYYWPTVEKVEGIDNSFFNYGSDGVKTLDLMAKIDFDKYKFPLSVMVSTLILGNDFRYDENDENPKRNFTTYIETSYKAENIFEKCKSKLLQNINFEPALGVVLNNKAMYYTAGDDDKPSLVNFSLTLSKDFELTSRWTMPISLNYVHNGADKNTEVFGRNFLVFGTAFEFE